MLKSIKCERRLRPVAAFSLVELTLALGIAAFCLMTVFALVPVAVLTNRNATSQTAATNVMAAVVTDLRATPTAKSTSAQFGITYATSGIQTRYFDDSGTASISPTANSRYRLDITWSLAPARITLRGSEGLVAGICDGGKCEWLYGNVCCIRQELA